MLNMGPEAYALMVGGLLLLAFYFASQRKSGMSAGEQKVIQGEQGGSQVGPSALDMLRKKASAGMSLNGGYSTSHFVPEQLHQAEQEAWGASGTADSHGADGTPAVSAATAPYSEYLSGAVADARMVSNQKAWAKQTRPYSGVSMTVDTLNPGDYINFVGLRRPRGVKQSATAWQRTEVDEGDLAGNKHFLFNL
jgi:hypothetical protein